jgi:hypothetical protein
MRDNQLFSFVRAYLLDALPPRGFPDAEVRQSFQPQQAGRAAGVCIYMHKLSDTRRGQRKVTEWWDDDVEAMRHREVQIIESAFQFNALVPERDPANDTEYTAADVLKATAAALQSDAFIEAARLQGVQILRVADMVNTAFENERGEFEYSPSFDVRLAHEDAYQDEVQAVTAINFDIKRV